MNANHQPLFRRQVSVQAAQQPLGDIVLTHWLGHWIIIALLAVFIGTAGGLACFAIFTPRISVEGQLFTSPYGSIGAEVYVPPRALEALRVGEILQLQYRSYPYPAYGRYEATVSRIASTASAAGATSSMHADADEPAYRIELSLKRRSVMSGQDAVSMPLAAGMHFTTEIPLQAESVSTWFVRRRAREQG